MLSDRLQKPRLKLCVVVFLNKSVDGILRLWGRRHRSCWYSCLNCVKRNQNTRDSQISNSCHLLFLSRSFYPDLYKVIQIEASNVRFNKVCVTRTKPAQRLRSASGWTFLGGPSYAQCRTAFVLTLACGKTGHAFTEPKLSSQIRRWDTFLYLVILRKNKTALWRHYRKVLTSLNLTYFLIKSSYAEINKLFAAI